MNEGTMGMIHYNSQLFCHGGYFIYMFWKAADVQKAVEKVKITLLGIVEAS